MKTRMGNVEYATEGTAAIVTIQRPRVRNCVDGEPAASLAEAAESDAVGAALLG